jgi:prepilin-type N-terminal cleavage/methylation domain-containing protein/prepilin-type processing-associated H-X9-DG protein
MRKHHAFTLIELLVVIAIIAVLMSILVPGLRWSKEQALRVRCAGNLRDIGRALYMYADTFDQKLPPGNFRGQSQDPWTSYTAYSVETSAAEGSHIQGGPWNLAHLYEAKLCPMPEIFYCPGARHIAGGGGDSIRYQVYKSYSSPGHPWPWNSIGGHLVRTGYMYFPQSKQKEDVHGWKLAKYTDSIHELSNLHTVVTELIHIRAQLPHCMGKQAKGVNALFGDGHVNFSTNQGAFADELWSDNPGNNPMNFRLILSKLEP